MNLQALKTPRGCLTLIFVVLALVALFGIGTLRKDAKLPLIVLAAEDIPLPYSQAILVVGLGVMLYLALRLALLGYRIALLAPLVIFVECLVFFNRPIPNTLPSTWLTMFILMGIGLAYNRAQREEGRPSRLRAAVEAVAEGMLGFMENAVGEKARLFFPLVATFFLFIALSNWCGILPGFGSVGVKVAHHVEKASAAAPVEHEGGETITAPSEEHGEEEEELVPFFRSANAHLSTTLALALVSVVAAQYFGFRVQGAHYLNKYLNFRASSPKPEPAALQGLQGIVSKIARSMEIFINGIVGLLEILLEALKVLPFSFRLFGNIFAGEVLVFIVSFLFAFVFPIIFLVLELFVGMIQGLIFAMLTLVFFSIATTAHHGEESH